MHTKFLAFGDSLTEGKINLSLFYGVLTSGMPQSYPNQLQNLLRERYTDQTIVVLNAGFGGERASEGLGRLNEALREARPEVLLIMHGANDLLAIGEPGIRPAVDAIEDLVKDGKAFGARVMLATLPPQRPGGSRAEGAPYVADFNALLVRMGLEEGAIIVDVFANFDVALQGVDGLHPSEAGYFRIAEIFRDRIRDTFEVAPAATAAQIRGPAPVVPVVRRPVRP
jgi:lysophospholipase L1-like esterase